MNFPFYIARRYLVSKKSHHAINIISGVSVFGIAIATAALVCILSVFNGFQDMVAGLFTAFDPQLKILPTEGKYMAADEPELMQIRGDERIAVWSEVVEDNALFTLANRQVMGVVKGVDDEFEKLIDVDRIRFGEGVFELHADVIDYGVAGIGLLSSLGTSVDFPPIQVYAPRKGERIDLNNPTASFNHEEFYSPQLGFNVKQGKYDAQYVITNIALARRLFERQGEVTQIELQLKDGADTDKVKADLTDVLGTQYKVLDRYEQQEDTFRIMKVEKLISYIFLTFILLIACFNIIGSLSMLIIDKREDAVTLRNLGASDGQIAGIFMLEGRMIALVGAVVGIVIGLTLCLIQQEFGVIKFGKSAGSYIIDVYPVSVHAWDLVVVFLTVVVVGFASVWYPVRRLSRKYTKQNYQP
ncbi:MAG: ABC transporter permease [Bacteroidales bacterium]|nr:ABC transporter permease [Bacteroidales bacterium]